MGLFAMVVTITVPAPVTVDTTGVIEAGAVNEVECPESRSVVLELCRETAGVVFSVDVVPSGVLQDGEYFHPFN